MLPRGLAESEFTNTGADHFIQFCPGAQECLGSYLIHCYRYKSALPAREYLNPDTVLNLHGHCQPENDIFHLSFKKKFI